MVSVYRILDNDFHINYIISELKSNLVLQLGSNDRLNTIISKYFSKWYQESFEKSYGINLTNYYFNEKELENLEKDSLGFLQKMCDEGKTSMLQDVLAGRKTEVEIFAGEIIRLGKLYEILTPCNQVLYDLIKIVEER